MKEQCCDGFRRHANAKHSFDVLPSPPLAEQRSNHDLQKVPFEELVAQFSQSTSHIKEMLHHHFQKQEQLLSHAVQERQVGKLQPDFGVPCAPELVKLTPYQPQLASANPMQNFSETWMTGEDVPDECTFQKSLLGRELQTKSLQTWNDSPVACSKTDVWPHAATLRFPDSHTGYSSCLRSPTEKPMYSARRDRDSASWKTLASSDTVDIGTFSSEMNVGQSPRPAPEERPFQRTSTGSDSAQILENCLETDFGPRKETDFGSRRKKQSRDRDKKHAKTSFARFSNISWSQQGVEDIVNKTAAMKKRSSEMLQRSNSMVASAYRLELIMRSPVYNILMSVIVLANVAYICAQVELGMAAERQRFRGEDHSKEDVDWFVYDLAFCIVFSVELMLRIMVQRCNFCKGRDWAWNYFDSGIVGGSVFELVGQFNHAVDPSTVRVLRILRVLRVLRVISATRRMPFLQNLQLMLLSLAGSLPALLPAVWVLGLLVFFFGIFFMQGLESLLASDTAGHNHDNIVILTDSFGSTKLAAQTLFMSVSGGIDWGGLQIALSSMGWMYEIFFIAYIFFAVFAVLNVLTGIFVEAARQFSADHREFTADSITRQERRYTQDLIRIFADIDTQNTGTIAWENFERHFRQGDVRSYMRAMELDIYSVKRVFELMDTENTGEIDAKDFVRGCVRLRGQAKAVDLAYVAAKMEKLITCLPGYKPDTNWNMYMDKHASFGDDSDDGSLGTLTASLHI